MFDSFKRRGHTHEHMFDSLVLNIGHTHEHMLYVRHTHEHMCDSFKHNSYT